MIDNNNKTTNEVKSKPKKKRKVSLRALTFPIFAAVSLNLIFSIGLGIYTKNNSHKPSAIMQNETALTTQNVSLPTSSSAMLLKAVENLNNSNNVTINSSGEIKTFTTQKIKITKMHDGTTYFSEYITTGLKNAANRIYYTKNYAIVNIRGTQINDNGANWNGTVTNYSLGEFINKFHLSPAAMLPYEINQLTITSSSTPVKNNNGYEFNVNLHPKLSTKNYAKNLQTLTKLNNEFNFKSVTLHVVLDDNFNFVKVTVSEKYDIKVLGITKACQSNVVTNFDYKTPVKIPVINN